MREGSTFRAKGTAGKGKSFDDKVHTKIKVAGRGIPKASNVGWWKGDCVLGRGNSFCRERSWSHSKQHTRQAVLPILETRKPRLGKAVLSVWGTPEPLQLPLLQQILDLMTL